VQLWQIVLASVCGIIFGVFIGILAYYLIFRFVYYDRVTLLGVFRALFVRRHKITSSSYPASPSGKKHEVFPVVEDRARESLLRLLAEFERNCRTAREFSGDNGALADRFEE
jgi:hypothetical protein